jgi:N-acetylneuraminic acid mutarotase
MNVDIKRLLATLAFCGIARTLQAGSATWKANPVDNQRNECVDDWNPTSLRDVPAIRSGHTAVWTGSKMIVWGGYGGASPHDLNTGGQYDPNTDNWIDTSTINAPEARNFHTAIWTGSEMIVWGGAVFDGSSSRYLNSGGRYNPATGQLDDHQHPQCAQSQARSHRVWTGSEMIIWGGQDSNRQFNTGARYDPATDSWTPTKQGPTHLPRDRHRACGPATK